MATTNKIFDLLPAAQQKALEREVATSLIRNILHKSQTKTFEALLEALAKSEHWALMKTVRVSEILAPRNGTGTGTPTGQRGRPRVNRISEETIETVLSTIEKNPGLRSEELQKKVGFDQKVVKTALARLRQDKRVKTKGDRRTTTYAAA